jgi:tRNA A37 methylthiotransferase MiaB
VYFIHGLPGQTESTVDATVRMIEKSAQLGASRIILYRFQSLPMSAFTACPSGPPSAIDPESKRIYEVAKKVNEGRKEEMLGLVMKVVIAERYERDSRYLVAYPLNHGPVVLVEGDKCLIRDVVPIEVTDIASERIVYGKLNK